MPATRALPSWQDVAMQPQMDASGFQFLFTGLPENVEYYVEAGPASSKHFNFRVVDLPAVKEMAVTYRYPHWTGDEDRLGKITLETCARLKERTRTLP